MKKGELSLKGISNWERFCLLFRPTHAVMDVDGDVALILEFKLMGGKVYVMDQHMLVRKREGEGEGDEHHAG